jgi:hypothetical protein
MEKDIINNVTFLNNNKNNNFDCTIIFHRVIDFHFDDKEG